MKYVEIVHDDFVIIHLNKDYFSLPMFIYDQIPMKYEVIAFLNTIEEKISKKAPEMLSKLASKIIKIKRTKSLR